LKKKENYTNYGALLMDLNPNKDIAKNLTKHFHRDFHSFFKSTKERHTQIEQEIDIRKI
jgi:hypothetical protein